MALEQLQGPSWDGHTSALHHRSISIIAGGCADVCDVWAGRWW
jgi:hypothetical protein